MIILFIILPLFFFYSLLIIYYWLAWRAIPVYSLSSSMPRTKISVIIAARNEEKNIGPLLAALQEQSYPAELFEVIVVDDHSDDTTTTIVKMYPKARLIQLKEEGINSYKKKAIETGIAAASGELVVTTDADCLPTVNWLQTMAAFREEKRSVFIAAPVVFSHNNSLLQVFQALDFLVLQGITGASVHKNIHSMCNGANLAYEKNVFTEVNGFSGIDSIASGDDMLLMYKIWKQYPGRVHYLKSKEVIITTHPMKTWKDFFNQRIRWASKAKHYSDKRITGVLFLVYIFNLSFAGLAAAGFFCPYYWLYLAGLWIIKTMIEFPFVYSTASFFGKRPLLKYFFFFQPLHIFYTILSGFLGLFVKYEWKGRRVH